MTTATITGPKLRSVAPVDVLASATSWIVGLGSPGTDPAAWSSSATYALNATVSHDNSTWLSLQGSNLNKVPGAAGSATWWVRTGPTNAAAMFDGAVNTATRSAAGGIAVALQLTTAVDTLVLLEATCVSATVSVVVDGQALYSQTKVMNQGVGGSWWSWLFADRTSAYTGNLVFAGLPPVAGAFILVDIAPVGSEASVGLMLLGRGTELGVIEAGATAGVIDYSTKTTDAYGTTTLAPGAYANRPTYPVLVPTRDLQRVRRHLISIRGTTRFFYGSDGDDQYDLLNCYGWLRDHRFSTDLRDFARANLEVEGLI